VERLRLAGHALEALSVGGLETAIALPELKLAFDIGRCPLEAVLRETVLFTHGHMDHMGGVAYHAATRTLRHMRAPTYVIPPAYAADFEALFEVWKRLDRSTVEHRMVTIGPGEEHALPGGLLVRPFRTYHTAPSQGYALVARREKLRAELAHLSGPEIARRRKAGEAVTQTVETVEVAYCGDTMVEVLEREPLARAARLLILETTFVDDRVSVAESRGKGHIHLYELAERAELLANEAILLHHFSARFRAEEIVAALERVLPAELRARVTPLVGAHRGQRWESAIER
jgi:ribonuclease Z